LEGTGSAGLGPYELAAVEALDDLGDVEVTPEVRRHEAEGHAAHRVEAHDLPAPFLGEPHAGGDLRHDVRVARDEAALARHEIGRGRDEGEVQLDVRPALEGHANEGAEVAVVRLADDEV